MQHLDEGTIHSLLDGALSVDEAARVEAHVAECPQCAAAVAEARGFIAASSRILTALDHVPRGVVPAAASVSWYNRAAWRAAAAVLVVAVGSLMVVRNGRNEVTDGRQYPMVDSTSAGTPRPAPPIIIAASPAATPARKPQAQGSVTPSTRSALASGVASSGKPAAEADFSGKSTRSAKQSSIAAREGARDENAAIGRTASTPSTLSGALAAPQAAPPSRVEEVAALDAATEQPRLKVVGTPRVIGAKVTLYEVAPGDTVTFTVPLNVHVEAVVVTGISTAEPQARRSVEKSAAAAPTRLASPASAVPPLQVEVVNGVTTINWPDATTGNMLKLSGRLSVERLKEIKSRIERERAAAAKKNP